MSFKLLGGAPDSVSSWPHDDLARPRQPAVTVNAGQDSFATVTLWPGQSDFGNPQTVDLQATAAVPTVDPPISGPLETTFNLVVNGDAEQGPCATDFSTWAGTPAGWHVGFGNFEAVLYAIGGTDDLNANDSAAHNGGNGYFAGGPNNQLSDINQTVDLQAYAAAIDAGSCQITLTGDFGGWMDQNDGMWIDAIFLGASNAFLGTWNINGPDAAERGNQTGLIHKEITITVPVGTRSIDLQLSSETDPNIAGTFNDGYADNISLTLQGAGLPNGLVVVSATHSFTTQDLGTPGGVAFRGTADSTATFLASQMAVMTQHAVSGDAFHDTLKIQVGAAGQYIGLGLYFDNWDNTADRVVITGSGKADGIVGTLENDTITGGKGNDLICGWSGADKLNGGAGADTFRYGLTGSPAADSNGNGYDTITGFDFTQDKFMLPAVPGAVDHIVKGGVLNHASFDADLATLVNPSKLSPGHAVLVKSGSGDLHGDVFLVVDCNGLPGYQAGADMVVDLHKPLSISAFGPHDFVAA